jgi:membrane protease YdiL (CAAX protease family)
MIKLTGWIKRHQIVAFFTITFAISWGLGFSYRAVYQGQILLIPLAFVATCGPALGGIIISAVSNTQPRQGTRKAAWIAFFVALVVSALALLANNKFINHTPLLTPVMVGFTLVIVVPVAFVISMAFSRLPAVRNYLSSLIRLRGVWGWAFMALVIFPGLILLSIPISCLLGRQPITFHYFPETGLALIGLIAVKFFYQFFFFNATGEEVGWRGFALPRMQSLTSPLVACLVMNLFWALWHLFYWMVEGRPVFSPEYWGRTYLELLPATVAIGWLYNRSKGSILVAGIAHAAANTAFMFFPGLDWTVYTLIGTVAALVMILVDRMWKKLPPDHPAVYRSPEVEEEKR